MNKHTKKELVPELRFPEFKNEREWEDKKFGESCHFVRGPFGGALKKDIFVSEGYAVYEQAHAIYDNFDSFRYFITEEKYEELSRFSVKAGDIIMSCSGTMGKFAIIPDNYRNGVINQALLKLTVKAGFNLEFMKHTLELPANQEKLLSQSAGGAIKNVVGVGLMKEIKLPIPNQAEQQKIADCLSSLDELITAHTQKHQTLQSYKKGLVQNLFPAEGETVPVLRFPEFEDAGGWHRGKLKKYIDLLSGYAFKSEYFSVSGKKLLTPKNFTKSGFANFSEENTKFTLEECDSKYLCTEGDLLLLLTDLTASCELLGKPILLSEDDGKVLLNQRIVKVMPNQKVNNRFLLYFFLTDRYSNHIKNTASGSTVRHSSNKIVLDTDIYFPSPSEQQKIADCLSSVDDLITAQAQKIEALKAHKKGLMQQLFPAVDGVTA